MTGKKLEIISQIFLWYENSFRIDCKHIVNYYSIWPWKHFDQGRRQPH